MPNAVRSRNLRGALALMLAMGVLLIIPGSSAGAEPPLCDGRPATIIGTNGDDVLAGTDGDDVIVGRGGNDLIDGGAGNDALCGRSGNDELIGGPGDDVLVGGSGSDTISYVEAASGIEASLTRRRVTGDATGLDIISGIEHVDGSRLDDVIRGDGGNNRLRGLGGDDTIHDGWGDDTVVGGAGSDRLYGSPGNDELRGGAGIDVAIYRNAKYRVEVDLAAGAASGWSIDDDALVAIEDVVGSPFSDELCGNRRVNRLSGGSGDDTISGRGGGDVLDGGNGDDRLEGKAGGDLLLGRSGNDLLIGAIGSDELRGAEGNDELIGGPGGDVLSGAAGNDTLVPGEGSDAVAGGSDIDRVTYAGSEGPMKIDLTAGTARGSGADTIDQVEDVVASPQRDTVRGDARDNSIVGLAGHDLLEGGSGDDTIEGGSGSDTVRGGRGADILAGDEGNDELYGGPDDDVLDGGPGNDNLYGGQGRDRCHSGEHQVSCAAPPQTVWGSLPWGSLDGIRFANEVPAALQARLKTHGFVIEESSGRHMSPIYESLYHYEGRSVFVTTDAAYHHWHLVFDKILRDTEQDVLLPVLEAFVLDLLAAARAQTTEFAGTGLADPASRVEEYLEAVATVLELDVGPIGSRAQEEVTLVNEHVARQASPTVGGLCNPARYPGGCVDYTRMKPRGHYTRTEELTRYFKAMSMLGNIGFDLNQADPFRVGLLLSRIVVSDAGVATDWERIYEPTAVIVGAADDYTPFEADAAAETVVPGWLVDPATLESDTIVDQISDVLAALRPVRINPEAASLRVMGVRFVLDSYVLDRLVVGDGQGNIRKVTALDVAASFGSDWALDRLHESDPLTKGTDYEEILAELRSEIADRTAADWSATVYDAWLLALEPSFLPTAGDSPPWMQTDTWQAKSHQTGFGSYTELKHDTILYGKEGGVEGDGPPPPPTVLHWVEPDPETFERITAAAELMLAVLLEYDLLQDDGDEYSSLRDILEDFIEICTRLADIAATELASGRPSDADVDWLDDIGGLLNMLLWRTGDRGVEIDPYGAVVADIFRHFGEVLEVGTGEFDLIHVIVPDTDGFQVATGAVYSYYEFWQPFTNRLTDEQWWEMIRNGELPPRPFWVAEYLGL